MDKFTRYRFWLLGVTLFVLIVLFHTTATGWLFKSQISSQMLPSAATALLRDTNIASPPINPTLPSGSEETYSSVSQRYPDDLQIQMANALHQSSESLANGDSYSASAAQHLTALQTRFPDSPSLCANILRYMTGASGSWGRDEENQLSGIKPPANAVEAKPIPPETLAAFTDMTKQGERIDPDNAFFPFMQAVVLFAARQDAEALNALHRAAGKSNWEEYTQDESEGRWRLSLEANGNRSAISRMALNASILFPHFAKMRSLARVSLYKAIEAEQAGHVEEGLQIRHDLMRCGGLMRAQSRSVIGSLVAIAIEAIATSRPGGTPIVKRDKNVSGEESANKRAAAYYAYLNRIGHPDEAKWAQSELEAGLQVKSIVKRGMEKSVFDMAQLARLMGWWVADEMVLANVLWILLLGGAWSLFARYQLSRNVKGILLGIAFFLAICFAGHQLNIYRENLMFLSLTSGDESTQGASSLPVILQVLLTLGSVAIPLLTLFILSVVSLVSRAPVSAGVGRGLRSLAVPIACVLLLVYSGMVVKTLSKENQVHHGLNQIEQHEGRYLAGLIGEPWPN